MSLAVVTRQSMLIYRIDTLLLRVRNRVKLHRIETIEVGLLLYLFCVFVSQVHLMSGRNFILLLLTACNFGMGTGGGN